MNGLIIVGAVGIGAVVWYRTRAQHGTKKTTTQNASEITNIWQDPSENGYDRIIGYSTPLAGQFGPGGTPDNITSVGNKIFGETAGNGNSASQNQVFFRPQNAINSQPDLSGALGSSGLNPPDEIANSLALDWINSNAYPEKSNVEAWNELYYFEPNLSSNSQDSDLVLNESVVSMPPGNNTWAGAAA